VSERPIQWIESVKPPHAYVHPLDFAPVMLVNANPDPDETHMLHCCTHRPTHYVWGNDWRSAYDVYLYTCDGCDQVFGWAASSLGMNAMEALVNEGCLPAAS